MTNWKFTDSTNRAVSRVAANGNFESCVVIAQEYIDWVAAGNIATPADPAPIPTDYSDSDNIDKTLKALLLCIAQVGGLTIPQAKTLFKSKFNALP